MSYFKAAVGKLIQPELGQSPEQGKKKDAPTPALATARSLFAAQVGGSLPPAASAPSQPARVPSVAICPRCRSPLVDVDGFYLCQGRCGRRWLVATGGHWLDPAALPLGACGCCRPRQALVAAECGAICPATQVEYLLLPEGIVQRTQAAPLGLCRCCLPPQPLLVSGTTLVCRAKPYQRYKLQAGQVHWLGAAQPTELAATVAAIDAALSANNAQLTLHGLFVVDP